MARLIIIDDDVELTKLLQDAASGLFSEITVFNSSCEFLDFTLIAGDIVLLDLMMPDTDGIEVIRQLGKKRCGARLVLISGSDESVLRSTENLAKSYGLKVSGYLQKPIPMTLFVNFLRSLLGDEFESGGDGIAPVQVQQDFQQDEAGVAHVEVTEIELKSSEPSVDELLAAIEHKQLQLYYQPQIDLKTNQPVAIEALLRWQHPEYGAIDPAKLVHLAEEASVIGELTEEIIDQAFKQCAQLDAIGVSLKMSVNLSADNILGSRLPEQLNALSSSMKIDASRLKLELNENALMAELPRSHENLNRLRLRGFQLSIDDFGTGYSSMEQLHKIPFTEMKIDSSFVGKLTSNPECQAIVETCIMLGHKLNMEVVAEGVEDEATLQALTALGCDFGQGFHLAEPMTPEKLVNWLNNRES